ncbi:MAG: hypothetical protein ABI240_17135 [Sphingomonas sp.]
MTIALFLLAAVSPCVSPNLCPTRKELIAAIMARAWKDINNGSLPEPKDSLMDSVFAPSRVSSVSDIVCGDALPDAPRSMNCRYTVRYAHNISYELATLVWRDGKWVITDGQGFWRTR